MNGCVCVQCYGEAFQGMASGMISAQPAEEQVQRNPNSHPRPSSRAQAYHPRCLCQARLSTEFGKLMSPDGLTKSIDRHNAMVFRARLVDFLATVRGFMMKN